MPAAQQAAAGHDHLAAAQNDAVAATTDPVALRDAKFSYGLEVVLDGLALRLPGARPADPPETGAERMKARPLIQWPGLVMRAVYAGSP
ncbi:hypothetical protein [Streptomyces sp. KR55]|uniref:hypothetical protein n=1 Tax=Streptomyces sp. KR55 TaxID=3457425 RepID=UPI003FD17EED